MVCIVPTEGSCSVAELTVWSDKCGDTGYDGPGLLRSFGIRIVAIVAACRLPRPNCGLSTGILLQQTESGGLL